ncbi:MAG TPA: hypothetical protein VM662_13875 [Sphingomonas sp.]|nr:hypothetical protein [Sphingomonas sp.]
MTRLRPSLHRAAARLAGLRSRRDRGRLGQLGAKAVRPKSLAAFALPLLLAACAAGSAGPETALPAGDIFGPASGNGIQTVVAVLTDGDSAAIPDTNRRFAAAAARAIPTSAAVALPPLTGDGLDPALEGYGTRAVAAVGESITALRRRYPRARIVVVGDAGGAALAANLAGVQPHLVDGIVLVACPCALPEWRAHIQSQAGALSAATSAGLDPLKTAGGISPALRAAVLVGADDPVTPVKFSRAYAEALTLRGIATDYRIVPGKGHQLLEDPEVLAATERLAAALTRKI